MANSYGPKGIVTDGLVFSADAGNAQCYTSGSATATDVIGGQTLTLENGSGAVIQPYDNSWGLDGSDDYIDCGDVTFIPSATSLSIPIWFKDDSTTSDRVLFGDNVTAAAYFSCELWGSNNRFYLELRNDSGPSYPFCYLTSFRSHITQGVWYNAVWVFDGTGGTNADKVKLYINGVAKTLTFDGTMPTSLSNSIGDFWVGNGLEYNVPFVGEIGPFYLYNRELTAAEVLQNYNSQKSRFGL